MRKINSSLICVFFVLFSCNNISEKKENSSINNVGIENTKIQPFYLAKQGDHIYNIGNEFVYSYKFIPRSSRYSHNSKDTIPTIDSSDTKQVKNIVFKIIHFKTDSIHNLSIQYNYPPQGTTTSSTIIENNKEIWIHPPRDFFFRILGLNPFPHIKKPYKIGLKWSWNLEIGEQWGDKKWREWKKDITNYYNYEIVNDTTLSTNLGALNCYKTISSAKSELGLTHLASYFNTKYGFVKLDYTNIDGSKISLELISYKADAEKLY